MRRSYPRDPYWLTAKFTSTCSKCKTLILKGNQAFYYPNSKTIFCAGEDCGQRESRSLDAAKFDEANCTM